MGIVACEKCGCANVSDSHFCRGCGFVIERERPETTASDLRMVEDARRLFAEGRCDQAALIATAVLDDNPYCVEALSVLGDCHEQLGYYSLALRCYRDIIAIEPESGLDRLRLQHLEKIVASGEIVVPKNRPNRNSMIGAAVAGALLFVSSGSALMVASDWGQKPESESSKPLIESQPFFPEPPVASNRTDYAPNVQTSPTRSEYQGLSQPEEKQVVSPLIARESVESNGGLLPGITGEVEESVLPVLIDPNSVQDSQSTASVAVNKILGDPDPSVLKPGPTDTAKARNMIVDVKPSKFSDPVSGTEPVEDNTAKIETLIRVARDQFVLGDYTKSADAYEKAITAGAPPSAHLQRLAQCYERLGRTNDAITAYQKAITAFEQLDQSDIRVQTQLDVCRQAVRVLRGA